MSAHRVPGNPTCPACGATLDGASDAGPSDAQPERGDASVCVYCMAIVVFDDDPDGGMRLRNPTDSELLAAMANPAICRARDYAWQFIRSGRGRR